MKKILFLCFVSFAFFSVSCSSCSSSDNGKDSDKRSKSENESIKASTSLLGEWFIIKVNNKKTAAGEDAPFLTFDPQIKKFNGFTGCNRIFGDMAFFSNDPLAIEFNNVGATKRACPEDNLEMEIINAVNSVTTLEKGDCPDTEPQCFYLCSLDGRRLLLIQKKISQQTQEEEIDAQGMEEN
ncbi:MAG: META domain-containing protein [Bacteroidales bacterium]|nr:META domain-containing protein [Bacteroidales bacterium]